MTERYYTVKKGDSLWGIAKHFGYTVDQLAIHNHLAGKQKNLIHVGQKILLPAPHNPAQAPDLTLGVKVVGLSGKPLANVKLKLTHDGKTKEMETDSQGWLHDLHIQDHLQGLSIEFENYEKKWQKLFKEELLPLGEKILHINTLTEIFKGTTYRKEGTQRTTTKQAQRDIKHATPQPQAIGSPRKPLADVIATPIHKETRTEGGQPTTIVAATFTGDNLALKSGNQKFRQAIIDMAKKHGFTPHAAAAIINAEAGKKEGGSWIENSAAGGSSARGLGQFLPAAWYEYIATEGTLGNAKAMEMFKLKKLVAMKKELYHCDEEGKEPKVVSNSVRNEVLGWRDNGGYSIEAILVYAKRNLAALKKNGIDATSLPPDEQVKIAYILHHEGTSGGILFLKGDLFKLDRKDIKIKLAKQLKSGRDDGTAKADARAERFDGDYAKAYYYFLTNHTDTNVRVKQFMLNKEGFNERTAYEVLKSVAGLSIEKPKAANAAQNHTQAAKPAAMPAAKATSKEESPTLAVGGVPAWNNPLAHCAIRVGGYKDSPRPTARNKSLFHPTAATSGRGRPHTGIDLAAVPGTPILAVANGELFFTGEINGYGKVIMLKANINDLPLAQKAYAQSVGGYVHDTIYFMYAHLNDIAIQRKGKILPAVKSGQVLGSSGNTGNAVKMVLVGAEAEEKFGAHLHFEVRRSDSLKQGEGQQMDPFPFIVGCQ